MKKIILVRHAKSSWEYDVSDHERPLNSRGLTDANRVSNELLGNITPELVLSSDALRAKTTAEIFITNLQINKSKLILNRSLYDFSGLSLTEAIKSCDDSIDELMIFGHNNAITNFVNKYGNVFIDNVPTCGVTVIEFEADGWNEIKKGNTILTLFPKQLK